MCNSECRHRLGAYAVLRISGCTLYSFANTKGTMPCGRAACRTNRASVPSKPLPELEKCNQIRSNGAFKWESAYDKIYLHNWHVKRHATKAHCIWCSSKQSWTYKESKNHPIHCQFCPTNNDAVLQSHEKSCHMTQRRCEWRRATGR